MKIKICFFWSLVFLLLASNQALAANFQNASVTISNPRLSTKDQDGFEKRDQKSTLIFDFTTETNVTDGRFRIIMPPEFDLKEISASEIACKGSDNNWQAPIITNASKTLSGELEIDCPFTETIPAGTVISIIIGNKSRMILNPAPHAEKISGEAEIYSFSVVSLDSNGGKIDEIFVESALYLETFASGQVGITAQVGKFRYRIFGYSSPNSSVFLEGINIKNKVKAKKTGYFVFQGLSPLKPQEASIFSQDILNRVSLPVNIASFPVTRDVRIGPILLPPTLSINKSQIHLNEKATVVGQTMPDAEVDFAIFKDQRKSLSDKIIGQVNAYSLPSQKTKSDKNGYFSINLSTDQTAYIRTFAQSYLKNQPSPKSITLDIAIFPFWFEILRILPFFILLAILIFLYRYFLNHKKIIFFHVKEKSIIVREKFPLMELHSKYLKRRDASGD